MEHPKMEANWTTKYAFGTEPRTRKQLAAMALPFKARKVTVVST